MHKRAPPGPRHHQSCGTNHRHSNSNKLCEQEGLWKHIARNLKLISIIYAIQFHWENTAFTTKPRFDRDTFLSKLPTRRSLQNCFFLVFKRRESSVLYIARAQFQHLNYTAAHGAKIFRFLGLQGIEKIVAPRFYKKTFDFPSNYCAKH